jgi:Zinc knuckle
VKKSSKETKSSSDTPSDNSDEEEDYDPLSVNDLIKESKAAITAESQNRSHTNGKSDLRRISSGGGQAIAGKTCHKCGKRGHLKRDCPN